MRELEFDIAGDRGVLVKFGDEIDPEVLQRLLSFEKILKRSGIPGIIETNWGYHTLFIYYEPNRIGYGTLINHLKRIEKELKREKISWLERDTILEIPVVYGGAYGPDLPLVAEFLDMSEEEVIRHHLSRYYLVYFTGMIGGTAYYKGDGELFNLPRKKTPTLSCPAGSVLLAAGLGSALKPVGGPTGWYSIGRSPLRQWYPDKDPPVLVKAGVRIRYREIDEDQFCQIKQEVDEDRYEPKYY